MNGLLDVLVPQQAPEPKGARVVAGKCGKLALEADAADLRRKDADELSPLTTKSGEAYREYHSRKAREYRQRKREGRLLRPRKPTDGMVSQAVKALVVDLAAAPRNMLARRRLGVYKRR